MPVIMNLDEIQDMAWHNADVKGFHRAHDEMESWRASIFIKLALVTTEVAEATEEVRTALGPTDLLASGFGSELADIIIRVADLAQDSGIDLSEEVRLKFEVNKSRPTLHGGKLA